VLTKTLAAYIAAALEHPLPDEARQAGIAHLLDTIASMTAGSRMLAGRRVAAFVLTLGGVPEASVVGSAFQTSAMGAAMANGMMAHADETDDSHAPSLTHPGCAIVPAALAAAERTQASGSRLLRAVVLGYDVGTRIASSLGGGLFLDHYHHSSHAYGGVFGACAAASALLGLDARRTEHALAYAVQFASGIPSWLRDEDHIEKAFLFGGMPAQHGVQAALMAAAGFTGSSEPIEGAPGLLVAFPDKADASKALEELGTRFEICRTTIKKWSAASPIQSALDSIVALRNETPFGAKDVGRIDIVLPPRRAVAVDNRAMPAVNIQQQLALLLIDGALTFASGHDVSRMSDPEIVALRERIRVVADPQAIEGGQAYVTVNLTSGVRLEKHTAHVRGTPRNPMTLDEVLKKARDLIAPVLGDASDRLLERLVAIEAVENIASELSPLLRTRGVAEGEDYR
jgi:2-methylcitrate dehydratase PrpD